MWAERIGTAGNPAGARWLAGMSADPAACLEEWINGREAPVPLGQVAVLRVAPFLGLRLLERLLEQPSPPPLAPVLRTASEGDVSVGFLVPAGAGQVDVAADLFEAVPGRAELPGAMTVGEQLLGLVRLEESGVLWCPAPGRALPRRRGTSWLVEPDGSGRLWDAAWLGEMAEDLRHLWALPDPAAPAEPAPFDPAAVAAFFGGPRLQPA
ncbi:hypothetical protein [Kitasatospora sp. NPDC088134]|uniref:hypothetical protein n=1 Tax=Kitasatospora sp. NPDC088134 TaxID=3364071 RepID=UPI0037FE73D3